MNKNINETNYSIKNPQIILSWKAPARAYKRKTKGVVRFYFALAVLLSLIAFLLNEIILILPIWTILFLFYMLTITPPPEVENRITHFGITSGKNTYRWEVLSHFYITKKFDYYVITILPIEPYLFHVFLVVKSKKELESIVHILSKKLIYQDKPERTITDKLAEILSSLLPDEKEITKKEDDVLKSSQTIRERQKIVPNEARLHLKSRQNLQAHKQEQ